MSQRLGSGRAASDALRGPARPPDAHAAREPKAYTSVDCRHISLLPSSEQELGVRNKPTQNSHPFAEAAYRVIPAADSAFAVEVSIPGSYPTKVSPFSTEGAAETWIAGHRLRVQSSELSKPYFRR